MKEEIICAGFGGQGIMFLGKLLAYLGMKEGKFVTWMPSYGAEVRGGTAHSMVIISSEEIASPLVNKPTTAIIMNQPSADKFLPRIKSGSLAIINTSLAVVKSLNCDLDILKIPATEIAVQLGNIKTANMVILGAYLAKNKICHLEKAKKVLKEVFSGKLLKINEEALDAGYEFTLNSKL
ncbi:MAG: 2-oxoacid:acceptor oxidoreductase family protein [Candidatus Omnitrophica bacterium]|nr:2-oxoacid:acceptor oxidoreductase family protein [Candidatus Omnitrophota bacterium]